MNIGNIIKDARIRKGLTQEQLASFVGVQKSAVAKWETGRVSEIKRGNLQRIALALGIDPSVLLGREENITPPIEYEVLTDKQQELMDLATRLSDDELSLLLDLVRQVKKMREV